jgi:hypothetical protein
MAIDKREILTNAQKGLEFLKRSRPGAGPMDQRREAKAKGTELVLPFFKVSSWPAAMKAEVDQLFHELGEL